MMTDKNRSTVSWISSAQAFFSFFPGVFTGSLFDKYGHRPLVCGGTILVALGFVLLSFSKEYYQIFLCHATLIAWGCNLLFVSPLGVVGQWFMRRRGLAL
jgi:MFS family permease